MEHPERLGHGEHAHTTDASADRTEPQPEPDVEGKTPETGEFPLRLATNPRSSVVQPRRKQAYLARRWLAMGLATLALLALAIGVMARLPLPVSAAHLANARYGSNYQQMVNAVKAAQWPQQKSNWCGVASITAIIRYEGIGVTQGSMSSFLDSSAAVSTWGTPSNAPGYYGPGFAADISRDFGTDPRSLAEGLASQTGHPYHQFIDEISAYDATLHLAVDIARSQQPITVFVDHALHSIVISGEEATANPITDPASVTSFEVWDPGYPNNGIQNAQEVNVSLHDWLTESIYWGEPYSANTIGSITFDPNPAVGPYTNDPSQDEYFSLWVGHYVYIRPDATTDPSASVGPDWAFDQYDALIGGEHGEAPSGYHGQYAFAPVGTVTTGITSIDGPAFWTSAAYLPPRPSAPYAALAWTDATRSHTIHVMLSLDGLHYNSEKTLSESSLIRPAIVVAWVNGTTVVTIAWTGGNSAHNLNVLYDVYGALGSPHKLILPQSSLNPPSLTIFQGKYFIGWTAADNHHTLHVMSLGANATTPGADIALTSDPGAGNGPTLQLDNPDHMLLLVWQQSGSQYVTILKSSNGTTWQGSANPPGQRSFQTPHTIVINGAPANMPGYYLTWTSSSDNHTVYAMNSFGLNGWPGPAEQLTGYALGGPEIGYVGHHYQVIIAWTDARTSQITFSVYQV